MKKGKSCVLKGYKKFKSTYGTVDSKNLKSIYLNLQTWVEPKNVEGNWERVISSISRSIKMLVSEIIDKTIFNEIRQNIDNLNTHTPVKENGYKYNNVNYNITCDISGGSIEYVDNYALKNSISNGRDLIIAKCFS